MELKIESPYLIKPVPGFTPAIGQLVTMMNYTRRTTLQAVGGLSTQALDHLLDDDANSIGMLLEHMACVEESYQANTFQWEFGAEAEERRRLGAGLGPDARGRLRGHDLDHHLGRLAEVRGRTLAEFARRDDAWLFEESAWWGGQLGNNYFKWFHVFEDELNHRGQIRVIRKRLPPGLRLGAA